MKRIFWIASLMITGIQSLTAQELPVKDTLLKKLLLLTVSNYPRIHELEEQLKIRDVQEEMIRAGYQPDVYASAGYQLVAPVPKAEFASPNGKEVIQFQPYNNYNTSINVSQLIYDFGKTRLALEKNNASRALQVQQIENSRSSAAFQVAQVYYGIRFLQNAIAVQEAQLASLRENERIIQAKINNGDALQYDLLTTQVRTANANNRLSDLKSQLGKQFILLQWFTGTDARNQFSGNFSYDDLPILQAVPDWKSTNPEAKVIRKKLDLLEYDYREASYSSRPSLVGTASGGFRNGFQPDIEQFRLNGMVGLGIRVPLVSADRPKLREKYTRVEMETQKKSLQTLEAGIQKDLLTVLEDYKSLGEKLANTNVLVQQAEKAYQLAQVRFKEGLITNVELLGAQSNVEDAKLQQVQLQYQMQLDKLETYKIAGVRIY